MNSEELPVMPARWYKAECTLYVNLGQEAARARLGY